MISKNLSVFVFALFALVIVSGIGSAVICPSSNPTLCMSLVSTVPSSLANVAPGTVIIVNYNVTYKGDSLSATVSFAESNSTAGGSWTILPSSVTPIAPGQTLNLQAQLTVASTATSAITAFLNAKTEGGAQSNYLRLDIGLPTTLVLNRVQDMNFKQNGTITITNNGQSALTNIALTQLNTATAPFLVSFNPSTPVSANGNGGTSQQITVIPNFAQSFNLKFGNNAITVKASSGSIEDTETLNFKKTFCSSGNQGGNLSIQDVEVNNEGSGDDTEWIPLDTIEIQVDVENLNSNDDIKDVTVELGLFNAAGSDKIGNLDFESTSDDKEDLGRINDGDTKTATFRFRIPADFNVDDSYTLTAKAYSKASSVGESKECADDDLGQSIDINEETDEDKFIVIEDIIFPSESVCGESVSGSFTVFNIGDSDQDDVIVTAKNTALGLNQEFNIRDGLNQGDNQDFDFTFTVPETARNGGYPIEFRASYDDGSSGPFFALNPLSVIGCSNTGTANPVIITASLQSDPVAGEQFEVEATIKNNGNAQITFNLEASGYQSWASSADLSKESVTLDAGESETITITFDAKDDASGAESFIIKATGNGLTETQDVDVEFPETTGRIGFNLFDGSNTMTLIIIGAVNLILIILIIVVAIRVARK